ncbi:MAG: hypothetical protein MUE52_08860 [Tabrizicola sp.]|jgi:threonine/homoserine/homoserine lactone efflux protein|nr:hypothetical protein [Tabrizicola sp.]
MSFVELTLAILVLLITPGPTNTLILLAGAERGLARATRLIPVELAAYLSVVIPLALIGQSTLDAYPGLRSGVAVLAAIWVAILAAKLWHHDPVATDRSVDARALFLTTLVNPKGLIFGLVLLPSPDRLQLNLIAFSLSVVGVALVWATFGAVLRQGSGGQPRALSGLRRLASVFLAGMSVLLVVRGVGA